MEGSAHGRVYRTGVPSRVEIEHHEAILVPVSARRERMGVLEVLLNQPPTEEAHAAVSTAGLLLGYLIMAADRWTDEFHVARRRKDMNLAAEIKWNLLPLAAVATDRASLACALEPAYEIGGDAFDYSCGRNLITGGVFDAMGRGVNAARVSALGVSAFRNGRRCGRDLAEQARFIHGALVEHFDRDGFMTGQLIGVDLDDPGHSLIVNAGHPAPLLQREGGIEALALDVDYPFGAPFENPLSSQPLELARGDRLILFSDGVVEARPDDGEPFGDDRLIEALQQLRSMSARETARRLISEVRAHRAGELTDDATLMIVDLPS
jgi:serine phosphatase RsbU (regulator of sigma subunit)